MRAHGAARIGAGLLAASLLAHAAAQAPASPAPPSPPLSVATRLEQATALAAQDPRGARKLLLELLEAEGPSEALKPHVAAIDALLQDTQFALAWRPPATRDLPGGVIGKWTDTAGPITLRYTRSTTIAEPPLARGVPDLAFLEKLADNRIVPVLMLPAVDHVLAGEGILVHQADFGPEWALEIKGDLPEDESNVVPHVFLCVEPDSHYDLALTWPMYMFSSNSYLGGEIEGRQGYARRLMKGLVVEEHVDPNPIERYGMKKRRSYTVVVKLKPDEIFFSINGMAGPRIPRDPQAGGRLGYTGFPRVTSIEVTGAKDGEWVARLAQARRDEARAKFDAEKPVDRALPAWWAGMLEGAATTPGG